MTDADEPKPWFVARIDAVLHSEWIGNAGKLFRRAAEVIEQYNESHVHIDEKMEKAPEVLWKSAQIKSSQTDKNIAETEETKISAEFARKAMPDQLRVVKANADTAETNALIAKAQLVKALYGLSKELKDSGTTMKFLKDGSVITYSAPEGYNYEELNAQLQKLLLAPPVEAHSTGPS